MPSRRRLLAVDPSMARTGWAIFDIDDSGYRLIDAGAIEPPKVKKATKKSPAITSGMRVSIYMSLLGEVFARALSAPHTLSPGCLEQFSVCYERARKHRGVDAAHAWGLAEGLLQRACSVNGLADPEPVSVAAIKMAAVGKGGGPGTDKPDICKAAARRWPGFSWESKTGDEADAAFCGVALLEGL